MDICEYLQKKFKLIKREKYREYDLTNNTKKILCDIGLPLEPLYFIHFNIEDIENIILDEENIIIGDDLGTYICVNSKDEIVTIDPKGEYPKRFINKNLEAFLEFIVIYLSYEDIMKDTDDDIDQTIQEIREKFDMIDAQALSSEENWWSLILEQVELGLM